MTNKSIKTSSFDINPLFNVPEGVEEFVYYDDSDNNDDLSNDVVDGSDVFVVDDADEASSEEVLSVPNINSIISQTIRRTATGNSVTDVLFDVTDVPGNVTYEFRLVKI